MFPLMCTSPPPPKEGDIPAVDISYHGTVGSAAASHIQSPRFYPERGLPSVWCFHVLPTLTWVSYTVGSPVSYHLPRSMRERVGCVCARSPDPVQP